MVILRCKMSVTDVINTLAPKGEDEWINLTAILDSKDSDNDQLATSVLASYVALYINDPKVLGKFPKGKIFFVDFTPCDEA